MNTVHNVKLALTAHQIADTTLDLGCINDWVLASAPHWGAELADRLGRSRWLSEFFVGSGDF